MYQVFLYLQFILVVLVTWQYSDDKYEHLHMK